MKRQRHISRGITVYMKVLSNAAYIFVCTLPPVIFCICSGKLMLPMAAAVFLHESAHLAALRALGGRMCCFRPAPFGLCMELDESSLSLRGEALVSAAGCIVNLLSAVIAVICYRFFSIDILDFGTVSLLVALVNLVPAEPLDGGRLLYLAISALFGPFVACRVSAVVTYLFGFAVFLFASYMLLASVSGIYPLLFSVYIFAGNAKMLEKAFFEEKQSF